MPELPDVAAYLTALDERIGGRKLLRTVVAKPFVLRTAQPPLSALEGRTVRELRRLGKRIAIGLSGDFWIVIHLMIAGRLQWSPSPAKPSRNTLAIFEFDNGSLLLTEAGAKRRASIHVVAGEAELQALDPGGIDVLAADVDAFEAALRAENRTLKRALTDPHAFSGIGNAYSDEILHAARLSPIALTQKLDRSEVERLHAATQRTLASWIERLRAEAARDFPKKVTAFRAEMAVHGKYGQPCPVCGSKVQRIRYADNETNYCARCQTGGRLLADRALSRLLKSDRPRTIEELEG